MEKLFSVNKFFLLFCAVFVLEWVALQIVGYLRLTSQAKMDCQRILAWQWPSEALKATVQIREAKVLKRESNDAVVKVSAIQKIQELNSNRPMVKQEFPPTGSASNCAVTLTYYKSNSQWFLGRVEWQ